MSTRATIHFCKRGKSVARANVSHDGYPEDVIRDLRFTFRKKSRDLHVLADHFAGAEWDSYTYFVDVETETIRWEEHGATGKKVTRTAKLTGRRKAQR